MNAMIQRPQLIVGLDFETFFEQGYSLKSTKLSITEYIRDERFKAHCVGIRTNRQRKARWYPHHAIPSVLAQCDWSRCGLLCHNTAFDGLILSHHYGFVPAFYYDTLSMARPLFGHELGAGLDEVARFLGFEGKVRAEALRATQGVRDLPSELLNPLGEYCADDVDQMWVVFRVLLKEYAFPQDELDLIHLTINAYANPIVEVDHARAETELNREIQKKKKIVAQASKILGTNGYEKTSKILNSNPQFADALRDEGVEPPKKISPRTGQPNYAFAKSDLEFQALEQYPNENVRTLVQARLVCKSSIGETRARRLLEHGKRPYKLPIKLNYARARTLRWSGGDKMNPQNFARGGELRQSIIAPKGYKLIVVDSSQIECRMNAWLWDQDDLLQSFATGGDPYCELASDIYARQITKQDKEERFVGKVGELGLGYGMGWETYQHNLAAGIMGPPVEVDDETAQKAVSVYRRKRWRIRNGWNTLEKMLRLMLSGGEATIKCLTFHPDGVDLPNGLMLHYPKLKAKFDPRYDRTFDFEYWSGKHFTKIYGGKFDENIIQTLARIVVGHQMLRIAECYRIVTMTHDEVVYLARTRDAERAYRFGLECLSEPPDWCGSLPCAAEGGFDDCYSK